MNIRKPRGMLTVFALVIMLSMLFVSCSEPQNEVPGSATLTVKVVDVTDAKTVTPSGNVDVSHYKITVDNIAEDLHVTSDYLDKGETFTVTNVPSGLWTATGDAYVLNEGNYIKVATATSAETRVSAGESATLTVTLDTLADSLSGDVTVILKMPSELDDENDVFWYTYSIQGTGQRSDVTINHETREQGTVGAEGLATISISDDLMQGSYLLTVNVYDSADESTTNVTRTGVDIMRLLPGLKATGQINLDSQLINEEGFKVQITDKVGDILTPATTDGKDTYEIEATDSETQFTVILSETVPDGFVMEWYVDGALVDATTTDDTSYTLMLEKGKHSVVGIMRDDALLMSVGSVSFDVNVKAKIEFTDPSAEWKEGPEFSPEVLTLYFGADSLDATVPSIGTERPELIAQIVETGLMKYTPASTAMPVIDQEKGLFDVWTIAYQVVDRQTGEIMDFADVMKNENYRGAKQVLDYMSFMLLNQSIIEPELYDIYLKPFWEKGYNWSLPVIGAPIIDEEINFSNIDDMVMFENPTAPEESFLRTFDWDAYDFQAVPVRIYVANNGEINISVNDGVSLSGLNLPLQYYLFSTLMENLDFSDLLSEDSYSSASVPGLMYPFYIHGNYLITDFDVFERGEIEGIPLGSLELYLMQGDEDMPLLVDMDRDERVEYLWTEPVKIQPDSRVQVALIPADADEVNAALAWITMEDVESQWYVTEETDTGEDLRISHRNGDISIVFDGLSSSSGRSYNVEDLKLYYTTDGSVPVTFGGEEYVISPNAEIKSSSYDDGYISVTLDLMDFVAGDKIKATVILEDEYGIVYGRWKEVEFEITEEMLDPFTYELNEDGQSYTVTGLKPYISWDDPEFFNIPASCNGKPVVAIGYRAFYYESSITGTVVIPDSITSIGSGAFLNCSAIESVKISENSQLTSIEVQTFYNCSSLTDASIPDSVTLIENGAFGHCSALTSINIPESLTAIDGHAFSNCSSLTSIIIPDGVTTIGSGAFEYCSALTSINIPEGVTSIEDFTFRDCSVLETVKISDVSQLESIGNYAFENCILLESITIPDSVTSIGSYAFRDCSSLTAIEISDSSQLESIGNNAFRGCSALTSINIPEGVTTIASGSFYGCISLYEVILPSMLKTIESGSISNHGAFVNCTSLESIVLPDSLTSIGGWAFGGCSALVTVEISDNSQLESIGNYAFYGCSLLENINIPEDVTHIGNSAFEDCSILASVKISDSSRLESIGNYAFSDCLALSSITIPDSVTTIGLNAFTKCISLTDIYCKAVEQPEDWDAGWLGNCTAEVHWGYTGA